MVCNVVVRGFDCLPAIANNRLRRVRDLCQSLTAGVITLDVARDAFKMSEIDGLGSDRQIAAIYLDTLIRVCLGGPTGIGTIAATMNSLADEVETFLLRSQRAK